MKKAPADAFFSIKQIEEDSLAPYHSRISGGALVASYGYFLYAGLIQ
jgi:hypothetical protein